MSICPKNKSSKARRDKRRANWKMSAMNLVKCSKCGWFLLCGWVIFVLRGVESTVYHPQKSASRH